MLCLVRRRLVRDLSVVEENLDFWAESLRQGQHLRTILFGQGPLSFAKDMRRALAGHRSEWSATDRIERRVGGALSELEVCCATQMQTGSKTMRLQRR